MKIGDEPGSGGAISRLGNTAHGKDDGRESGIMAEAQRRRQGGNNAADADGANGRLADGINAGLEGHAGDGDNRHEPGRHDAQQAGSVAKGGAVDWNNAVWWPCRDGKLRRVPARLDAAGNWKIEPALFPLADGLPNRVGILRGAGNAIVPQVAAEFIKCSEGEYHGILRHSRRGFLRNAGAYKTQKIV